jgi:hypothetical protein
MTQTWHGSLAQPPLSRPVRVLTWLERATLIRALAKRAPPGADMWEVLRRCTAKVDADYGAYIQA